MRKPAAPAAHVPDAPADSVLHRTAPYLDEVAALASVELRTFNVIECDRRIALLSRFVLEAALRDSMISRKDRADLALRAISALEGSKVRHLWQMDDEIVPIDVEAYDAELRAVESELMRLTTIKNQKQAADKALTHMGGDGNEGTVA